MRFVGIDPGQAGAVVVIGDDGRTALEARWWRDAWVPPGGVAPLVRPGDVVAIERPYVGKNAQSALALCEWIGWMRCLLPRRITLLRPLASEWRAKVLRRPRIRRELAKKMAVALCQRHSGLRHASAGRHDVAEAWLMARFAWGAHQAGRALAERPEITDRVPYARSA